MNKTMQDLKTEAEKLGLKIPGNISRVKLQAKIEAAKELSIDKESDESIVEREEIIMEETKPKKIFTPKELATREGGKLMRVRITCHDPQFKKHHGVIRAAGSVLYFKKRFVPFNRITHIEKVIYDFMKDAEYQWFEEKISRETGRKYKIPRSSPAFVIEDVEPLTKEELKELAKDQQARGAIED